MNDYDCFSHDLDTYRKWKDDAAKNGCTAMDIADQLERTGMKEYARKLREVIEKMEAAL